MDRKKILLVDDEDGFCKMVRAALGEELYEFVEESNGLAAQAQLKKHKFDLIITDVVMPDGDGIELIMNVRHNLPDIKIIVVSGGGRVSAAHYLDLAEKLGANRVFEKPLDMDVFRKTVQELLI